MPYFIFSTFFFLIGLVVIFWLHNQYQLDIIVEPAPPPTTATLISVCIPARNEERNIQACLEAILNQDYPNLEVIILDDRSTDLTPKILHQLAAENNKLQIVTGSSLPEGWAGKPHALYQASTIARGDWLCFIDADTYLTPDALSSCYAKAIETNADMITLMTFQILGSFWERTVMPLVMTALSVGFSPRKVNDPEQKDAIANGQFIFIKRSVYDAIGGHESVKDRIVEDKAIAEQVKWNGYRLVVADGMKVAKTRMYTSLPEMWEGWTKGIYLGLSGRPYLLALGVFGVFLAMVASILLPVWTLFGIFWYFNQGTWTAIFIVLEALMLWIYLIYWRVKVAANMKIPYWYAFTTPIGAAVFAAMMLVSTWKVLSGQGVSWRGRIYHPQ